MEEQGLALPAHTKKHKHPTDPWRDPSADLQHSLCTLPPSFSHFHFLHSTYNEVTQRALARQQIGLVSHRCSCCLPDCASVRYLVQCLHSGSLCDVIKWGWALRIISAFISTAEYLLMGWCSFRLKEAIELIVGLYRLDELPFLKSL